jgi:predicted transcriptional regulator
VATSTNPARDINEVKSVVQPPVISIKAYDSFETAAAVMPEKMISWVVAVQDGRSSACVRAACVLPVTDISRKMARILTDAYSNYQH